MEHIEERVHPNSTFCVTGMAPSREELKQALAGETARLSPTEHRFHFFVDAEARQVLVLWFCRGELHQQKMDIDSCVMLLVSLETCGFRCQEEV